MVQPIDKPTIGLGKTGDKQNQSNYQTTDCRERLLAITADVSKQIARPRPPALLCSNFLKIARP
jgi:hypothetical protein